MRKRDVRKCYKALINSYNKLASMVAPYRVKNHYCKKNEVNNFEGEIVTALEGHSFRKTDDRHSTINPSCLS